MTSSPLSMQCSCYAEAAALAMDPALRPGVERGRPGSRRAKA